MSAQVYPPQTYRMAPAPPGGPQRSRHPLNPVYNNAGKQYVAQATPPKAMHYDKHPEPKSPPLPRQNSKTLPPSPPKIILDHTGGLQFQRIGFLGEGGFARVYEVKDHRGVLSACKVVTKTSLKTKKAKTKLYAEIKIHKSLSHPNIVKFQECFEDADNVYMTLELCHNGSLMDMLRRRRRFTEPEARYYMVQLIGACHYMHTHSVIHRDLKLGNLFLDAKMNIKVGDFGLAALIESPGERKKTICGTPNYIAPEVLFDTANGHSFEVDTWSIGVIMYTLVIGKPPFQTKDVKAIYKRIRDNDYEFPEEKAVSTDAKVLVQQILINDPQLRPTLHDIVDHDFFTQGIVPAFIPPTAADSAPDFRYITRPVSKENLQRLRRQCLLDEDQSTSIALPKGSSQPSVPTQKTVTSSIAEQEKEFQRAVLPGSPISALLSSARQPLMMGNGSAAPRESPLFRKLQAAAAASAGKETPRKGHLRNISEEDDANAALRREDELRQKELESQKARIVAQMAPQREEAEERENIAPSVFAPKEKYAADLYASGMPARSTSRLGGEAQTRGTSNLTRALDPASRQLPSSATDPVMRPVKQAPTNGVPARSRQGMSSMAPPANGPIRPTHTATSSTSSMSSTTNPLSKLAGFDAAAYVLNLAFDARNRGRVFRDPRTDPHAPVPDEKVFIVSWVDYCNKYGMGYALTDGSVGVHFNDTTTMILSADKEHYDYITTRHAGQYYVRKSFSVNDPPQDKDMKAKVYLLKHFEQYIMGRLYGAYDYTFEDVDRTTGMEWVRQYLRMKQVIVFKLSHDVIQFNFYDHSKLVLSSAGLLVTQIDKNYNMTKWTLRDIMAASLRPGAESDRATQRLVEKLRYCREVLVSIQNASGQGAAAEPGPLNMAM
ncbi:kinase-like domain-containing protein [Schizophyllum fasciatum]